MSVQSNRAWRDTWVSFCVSSVLLFESFISITSIIPLFLFVSQTISDEVLNIPTEARVWSSISSSALQTHPSLEIHSELVLSVKKGVRPGFIPFFNGWECLELSAVQDIPYQNDVDIFMQ